MALTKDELQVIINIIGAVETGGNQYSKGRYDDFTEAFANTPSEKAITIGKYQHYGNEAKTLLQRIQKADPTLFSKLDTQDIASDLKMSSWANYRLKKTSAKAKCIVTIISSDVGKRVQDEMVGEQMQKFCDEAEKLGVTDHQAQCMCANWRHQGGSGAVTRILKKTKKPYTLDNLFKACQTDTGNQVGAYKTRQKKVYNWLKEYWPTKTNSETNNEVDNKVDNETNNRKGIVTASKLNFRVEPSTFAANLKSYPTLKHNDQVTIKKEITNKKKELWYYIEYNGKHGYVMAKWIKEV